MFESKDMSLKKKSTGDAAIDGLVAGLAGGIIGALILLVLGLFSGNSSINILQRFDATASGSALQGTVMHLAVSVIYGALFAILLKLIIQVWPAAKRISWLLGIIYGLFLMLLAEVIFSSGFNSQLGEISLIDFTLFHIAYGVTLGIVSGRMASANN
jgi:uncharacterized protein YacL